MVKVEILTDKKWSKQYNEGNNIYCYCKKNDMMNLWYVVNMKMNVLILLKVSFILNVLMN
jgi:hypothetical protein